MQRKSNEGFYEYCYHFCNTRYPMDKSHDLFCVGKTPKPRPPPRIPNDDHRRGFAEGLELAHNLALTPDVAPEQLALPTRPFQQADEQCTSITGQVDMECIKTVLQKEESLLLQTRDEHLAALGVRIAQDYAHFAMYLKPEQTTESEYNWYYDYALHYVEDRLSDY